MSDWEEKYSEQHKRKFWKHKTTGKTSWTPPSDEATSAPAPQGQVSEWEEKYSEQHKRKFWKHKVSGKTTWNDPTTAVAAPAVAAQQSAQSSETDEWEEKYSEQHKRKFWKNKKTGKTTWTDPTKTESAAVVPSANTDVADEWEEKYSEQHKRKFWKNKTTGKTTWTEPAKTAPAANASNATETAADDEWEEKYSEQHKRKFWKNKSTGKTTWTEPAKAAPVANAGNATETAADDEWEEKYSEQHKRKFWKNKKTGKTTWTEPAKTAPAVTADSVASVSAVDDEWEEKYSEQHKRKFWKNKSTGKTTWTEPAKAAPVANAANAAETAADDEWEEKYSAQHKRKFWKNKVTGKTSWTEPAKPTPSSAATKSNANTEVETKEIVDDAWEEKYSAQHKRKYWKHKESGKTSWTEPPKKTVAVPAAKKTSISADESTEARELGHTNDKLYFPVVCGFLWMKAAHRWIKYFAKLSSSAQPKLHLYKHCAENELLITYADSEAATADESFIILEMVKFKCIVCNEFPGEIHLQGTKTTKLRAWCKADAQQWCRSIHRRAMHISIDDRTLTCSGEVDKTGVICRLALDSGEKLLTEIQWQRNYLQFLRKEFEGQLDASVFTYPSSALQVSLEKTSTPKPRQLSERDTILPTSGLVVVSLRRPSNSKIRLVEAGDCTVMSLWMHHDRGQNKLLFYEHGPGSQATIIANIENASVTLLDITESVDFQFELTGCEIDRVATIIQLKFHNACDYWRWAVALSCGKAPVVTTEKRPSIRLTSVSLPSVFWTKSMLDFAIDAVGYIGLRDMVRRSMRSYSISGTVMKTAEFLQVNNRIIVASAGDTQLISGSVVISVNDISAIGLPGRSFLKTLNELPRHIDVNLVVWQFPRDRFYCKVFRTGSHEEQKEDAMAVKKRKDIEDIAKKLTFEKVQEEKESKSDNTGALSQDNAVAAAVNNNDSGTMKESLVWSADDIAILEDGKLKIKSKAQSHEYMLSEMQMRFAEVPSSELSNLCLSMAVELRDKTVHVSIGFQHIDALLRFASKLIQAMRLHGSVVVNLGELFDRCDNWTKIKWEKKYISGQDAAHILHGAIAERFSLERSPAGSPKVGSTRLDIIKASEKLEQVLKSFGWLDSNRFPTASSIYQLLCKIRASNEENHNLLKELLRAETRLDDGEEIESEDQSKTPRVRRETIKDIRGRSNSLLAADSPVVFVPPAVASERTKPPPVQTPAVTPALPKSMPLVDVPPLLEEEVVTPTAPITAVATPSPNMQPAPLVKQALQLSEEEMKACSDILFFLQDDPSIVIELVNRCKDQATLCEVARVLVARIYAHWSSDDTSLSHLFALALEQHFTQTSLSSDDDESSQAPWMTFYQCLLQELCNRPDMLGFIRHISDAGNVKSLLAKPNDVATLCVHVVEPICQRLDACASCGRLPSAFANIIRDIACSKHRNGGLLVFAEVLVPRVCQWLLGRRVKEALAEDVSEDASLHTISVTDTAQMADSLTNLLTQCFGRLEGARRLSLSQSAMLSRSKWLISRFVETCASQSLLSGNNRNPIRMLSGMVGMKPQAALSAITLRLNELQLLLGLCDVSILSSSNRGLEMRQAYHCVESLLRRDKSTVPLVFCRHDVIAPAENSEHEEAFYELTGAREVTCVQWIIQAAENSLKHLFSTIDIPSTTGVLLELQSLTQSLQERQSIIECCMKDMANLELCLELCGIYKSQILIVIDMIHNAGGHSNSKREDECLFSLSKLCHRQFEIETILLGRKTSNGDAFVPTATSIPERTAKTSSASNPLWVVMQSVFPSDELKNRDVVS